MLALTLRAAADKFLLPGDFLGSSGGSGLVRRQMIGTAASETERRRPPWWKKPLLISGASLLISVVGTGVSAYFAYSANHIQKSAARTQVLNDIGERSLKLREHVESSGIGDVDALTTFFYLLGEDRRNDMIPRDFYEQQIGDWCHLTRQAHAKLAIDWGSPAFQTRYESAQWFLAMLDRLAGRTEGDTAPCL
ncbi:MAG: hypothetical protein ACREFO_05050 [Acetobacteraceae bacterium]